jgi:hypothetical protein
MLKAAARFWDAEEHLFRFSLDELCPSFEEFCAIFDLPVQTEKVLIPSAYGTYGMLRFWTLY